MIGPAGFMQAPNTHESRQDAQRPVDVLVSQQQPPICHFTPMMFDWADDGCQQVEFWICQHCGHTKEIERFIAG